MTLGRSPLGITAQPFDDHELDNHPDGPRIWATIEELRAEFDDRLTEFANQIAAEFELTVDVTESGFMSIDWECEILSDTADHVADMESEFKKIETYVNTFGFIKALEKMKA